MRRRELDRRLKFDKFHDQIVKRLIASTRHPATSLGQVVAAQRPVGVEDTHFPQRASTTPAKQTTYTMTLHHATAPSAQEQSALQNQTRIANLGVALLCYRVIEDSAH